VRTFSTILLHMALGLWVGALVFVSFIVAPAVFGAVPGETAGTVMGAIFPRYYGFTLAVGTIGLAAAMGVRHAVRGSAWKVLVAMMLVMLAATAYAGGVVSPRARTLRPALHQDPVDPAVRAEFDALHRRAVQLNGLVLVLGLAAMGVAAATVRSSADARRA
jgi:hypothetical protein